MSSSFPPPLTTPTPTTAPRPSKTELLRLLREQAQEQAHQASAASSSSTSTSQMAAIIGGTVGGLILIGAIVVGIIVPLVRRRRLRNEVRERAPINVNLPFDNEPKHDDSLGFSSVRGEKQRYPTIESGSGRGCNWTSRESDMAGLVPLLGLGGGVAAGRGWRGDSGSPQAHSTFGSSIRQADSLISQPPSSIRYPTHSSTHLYQYQKPLPMPHEQERRQEKHGDLYFHYRTASSAAGGIGVAGSGAQEHGLEEVEFDPYAQYVDTPSPLDAIRDSTSNGTAAAGLERPSRALKPASPKKVTRGLPVPFEDNHHNNPFVDPAPDLNVTSAPNSFMSSSTVPTQAKVDNSTIRASQYFASNGMMTARNRSPSPKRPSFFSYRSSATSMSVPPAPPPGAQVLVPLPSPLSVSVSANPFFLPQTSNAGEGSENGKENEGISVLPDLDLRPVRQASDGAWSLEEVANATIQMIPNPFDDASDPTISNPFSPNSPISTHDPFSPTSMATTANDTMDRTKVINRTSPDSDDLSLYSQISPIGSVRRNSSIMVINNPFFGSVGSADGAWRQVDFISVGGHVDSGLGALDSEGRELGRDVDCEGGVVLVKRKAVKTGTGADAGVGSGAGGRKGRAWVKSLRGDVGMVPMGQALGGMDEHGRQLQDRDREGVACGEDVPWLVPHPKEGSSQSMSSSHSASQLLPVPNNSLLDHDSHSADGPSEAVEGAAPTSLSRMDTLALGNLIKSRAAKIVVSHTEGNEHHERVVSMIERDGSITGVDDSDVRGRVASQREGDSRDPEPVLRGRGVRIGEGQEEAYGAIRRVPVKRTVTPTNISPTTPTTPMSAVITTTITMNTPPSPTTNNDIIRRRSRSQSRGRLVPKASLKRPSTDESDRVDWEEPEAMGSSGDHSPMNATPNPIGRNPSKKYKPKPGLLAQQQQRLMAELERGLLGEGDVSMSATTLVGSPSVESSPVDLPKERYHHYQRTNSTPTKSSVHLSASPAPPPYAQDRKKAEKPPLQLSTAPPSQPNLARNSSSSGLFPLTGAFGLGQSPSARSPATPTYQYAFADLERTREFLPVTAPLNVASGAGAGAGAGTNASSSEQAKAKGKLKKASSSVSSVGAKEGQ